MAHGLRYYKELTHDDGKVVRLEILEKDYIGASMEIGPVCQALRLDIQGDTEIDAPIVKTSVTMTFVDAPDHADANTKKCGNWEEFYTSDATKWQVVIKVKKEAGQNFVTMWGGYITPDSYNEVLVYRGSVTLVARDNIGHMNDFPFDAEGDENGMISLAELVESAWAKIESPMKLNIRDHGDNVWMACSGRRGYETKMNVSAFKDKSWYEAVEESLYSYGAVMRYVGDNWVEVGPLRQLPLCGQDYASEVSKYSPIFLSGAEREMAPAVRRIEESGEYEVEEQIVMPKVESTDFTGSIGEYTCGIEGVEIDGQKFGTLDHQAPVWPLIKTNGVNWSNAVPSASLFFNPLAYEIGYFSAEYADEIRRYMYLAANKRDNAATGSASFRKHIQCIDMDIVLKFGTPIGLNRNNEIERATVVNLYKVTYAITLEQNGITQYYRGHGGWVTDYRELFEEYDATQSNDTFTVSLKMGENVGEGLLTLHIINIEYKQTSLMNLIEYGLYACIQSLTFGVSAGVSLVTKNNVNTNYDQQNNVILSREPKIVPALNTVPLPAIIRNGIFVQSGNIYVPAKHWNWSGHTPQQMAVYNHLQLLCYHAKPNNVIRGIIVNADLSDLRVIWMWHGAEHMLVSGSINYLNGYIENAVLREFARYEDMWGMLEPADLPDVEGSSSTNVESGASSGSKGASITNRTEVYIGGGGGSITLDSFMSDTSENGVMNRVIKAYVDDVRSDLTDLWHLDEDGNIVADKQVIIKNNLLVEGDAASGDEGEDVVIGGISGVKVNGVTYYDDNGDGVIDLGTISGGGGVSGDYLPLSGGTIDGGFGALAIKRNNAYASAVRFENTSGVLGYIGINDDYNARVWDKNGNDVGILIHSGNIGSQSVAYATSAGYADRLLSPYSYEGDNVIYNDTSAESLFSSSFTFSAMMKNCYAFDGHANVLNFTGYKQYGGTQLAVHYDNATPRMALRNFTQTTWKFTDWREFAFTDSDITGHASSATKLYASDTEYAFDSKYPYYLKMRYNILGDNSWYLSVYPETPLSVSVDKAQQLVTPRSIWGIPFDGTADILYSQRPKVDYYLFSVDGSNHVGYIGKAGSANRLYFDALTGYDISINANGVGNGILLDTNNNVGIGTTSPEFKLDVSGKFRASDNVIIGSSSYEEGRLRVVGKNGDTYVMSVCDYDGWTKFAVFNNGNTQVYGNLIVSGDVASA